ncbi:MAG TPA: LD-carboxypeptidase [Acidobacteriota bacterium]|nr:LD-carboxypeptidase [Acidobacteriota bacterium]
MSARRIVAPAPLAPGARIAVVAPGSSVRPEAVRAGFEALRSWGLEPVAGRSLFARRGDLAGPDEARAADLAWAFSDPAIDAVWCARGGWGTARLLPLLDLGRIAASRRWLLGFSDVTALQAALLDRGLASWSTPLVAELADPRRAVKADLKAALFDSARPRVFRPGARRALVPGKAEGTLAGGCLSVLVALAGTPWAPKLRGRIVVLEDVGEAPYRIDRLLWQGRAAGLFDGVAGLAFGQFVSCRPYPGRPSRPLAAVLAAHAREIGVPTIAGLPVGHGPRPRALPLGYKARLDADAGLLEVVAP